MADWLVHYVSGRIVQPPGRSRVLRECVILGAVLPDLPSKGLGLVLDRIDLVVDFAADVSHAPLMWVLIAYVLAHAFVPRWRAQAFVGFALGGFTHVLVDLAKDNMGFGAVMFGFPFSVRYHELGFYHPERTLDAAPVVLLVLVVLEVTGRLRKPREVERRHERT